MGSSQFHLDFEALLQGARAGLSSWASVGYVPGINLHSANVDAVRQAKLDGYCTTLHPLQGNARWAFPLDGNCTGSLRGRGPSATWAFLVFERVGGRFYIAGFRSGLVSLEEDMPFSGFSDSLK